VLLLIVEKQGPARVIAIMQRGLQLGVRRVCRVVGRVSICTRGFCLLAAATFNVSKSARGFLKQFAAK